MPLGKGAATSETISKDSSFPIEKRMQSPSLKFAMTLQNLTLLVFSALSLNAQEWAEFPVPADPPAGQSWQLVEAVSTEFNNDGMDYQFMENWDDYYMHPWIGPGLTNFRTDNSTITGGKLVLSASRKAGTDLVNCGIISSKEALTYPVFMEASIQVSGLVLSSNFWLLSYDSTQELDIIECYGGSKDSAHETKMKTNYHLFKRSKDGEKILRDYCLSASHQLPNQEPLRKGFHRIAAYWKDPYHIDFFLNGVHVRSITKDDFKESIAAGFTGLSQPMHIIFDLEDHDWRSAKGLVPTDQELADESLNKMYVDWIRVYKPE
ncbi:Beta-agarase [Coraliomargarita akajimensis DSM 45221]|uniref:Beta-agarase n=2 Tax=Coraliomargarita TaxID=442430 RepID=D5EKY1_CORAD|nr:Beta-agarase [Coraliomargarita akajimensis DSM 45221]